MTKLLVGSPRPWPHPSFYPVEAVVNALIAAGAVPVPIGGLYGKIVSRLRVAPVRRRKGLIVVPLMGPRRDHLADASIHGRPIVFAWDVWEDSAAEWVSMLCDFDVSLVFCTSTAARELLRARGFTGQLRYLPEATSIAEYHSGTPLAERPIQILELGRRWDAWHEPVHRSGLLDQFESRYEVVSGQIIFSTRAELIEGFASSAISVCFPRSMTHPSTAGAVETFTHRYLESMASGCLILGHAPADLIDLFGYNPVIEADMSDPVPQLTGILDNLSNYQGLVDRNLKIIQRVGDWAHRAKSVSDELNSPVE